VSTAAAAYRRGHRLGVLEHQGQTQHDRDQLRARRAEHVQALPPLVRAEQPDRAGEGERAQRREAEAGRQDRRRPVPPADQRTAITMPETTFTRNAGPITCTSRIPSSQSQPWMATDTRTAAAVT
jgi:hypothetical protein